MKVTFKVLGEIKSKQRPNITTINGKARGITPYQTIVYENYIREQYAEQCDNYSFGDKPVAIKVIAYFSPSQEIRKQMEYLKGLNNEVEERVICLKNKDFDNIYKIVCDSLNKIAYNDDKQIWNDMGFKKFYTLGQERLEIMLTDEKSCMYVSTDELKEAYNQIKERENTLKRIEKLNKKPKLSKSEKELLNELYAKLFKNE